MKFSSQGGILTILCSVVLCGCIHQSETVYHNPERARVEFENEKAARIFYETLSKFPASGGRHESNTTVEIPVVFEHHREVVEGENVAFNEAVRQCDTNQDGRITELEAKIFAEVREHRGK